MKREILRPRARAFAGVLLLLAGCKGKSHALAPIDLAASEPPPIAEAVEAYAPRWPAVERLLLSDGLLVHWLTEPGREGLDVRVCLPTQIHAERVDAFSISVILRGLEASLRPRFRGEAIHFGIDSAPGRIELWVHAPAEEEARVFAALGEVLAREPADARWQVWLDAERERMAQREPIDYAAARLLAAVLGLPPEHLASSPARADATTATQLRRGWRSLIDPRGAVLLVHAPAAPSHYQARTDALAGTWRAVHPRLVPIQREVVDRLHLRIPAPAPTDLGHPLGNPPRPLVEIASEEAGSDAAAPGAPVVILARVIATPDAEARAHARALERALQLDFDARLLPAGPFAVLTVGRRLGGDAPEAKLNELIDELASAAASPPDPRELSARTKRWLGGRMVASSLRGEDWTRLYSEAIDLATDDTEIAWALAAEAGAALAITPGSLAEFGAQMADPRAGDPAWHWVVVGGSDAQRAKLVVHSERGADAAAEDAAARRKKTRRRGKRRRRGT